MRKEYYSYKEGKNWVERFMTKGEVNTFWDVVDEKNYTPITVFFPGGTAGIDTRKRFNYKMPLRTWRKKYHEAMDGIVKMAVIVYKYYAGKTDETRRVVRNSHENKFNPIFEWSIGEDLYIVEFHSRANYIELRKAKKIDYKRYSTRVFRRTESLWTPYEYVGEM